MLKARTPHALRMAVWRAYASDTYIVAKCFCCRSHEISIDNFECGHVKSERNGGKATLENMRPICGACNKSMGTHDMLEFIEQYGLHDGPIGPIESISPIGPIELNGRSKYELAEDDGGAALVGAIVANVAGVDKEIHQGMPEDLKTKIILKGAEIPLYYHKDGGVYILLTNMRFIKLENQMIINESFLANIQSVSHVGGGAFHWDKVKIIEMSTKVQMFGIRRKHTCLGFINLLRQLTNCH